MDERTRIGYASEHLSKSTVIFAGYVTSTPDLSNTVYDYIIDTGGRLLKVQVKASVPNEKGRIKADTRKSHAVDRNYSVNDFDILSIVNPVDRKVCFIDWRGMGRKTAVNIWVRAPENKTGFGRGKEVMLFDDYLDINKAVQSVINGIEVAS